MKKGTQAKTEPDSTRATSLPIVEATTDTIGLPIALLDSSGTILVVNTDWGRHASDRIGGVGSSFRDISTGRSRVDPEQLARFKSALDEVLQGARQECQLTVPSGVFGREPTQVHAQQLALDSTAALIVLRGKVAARRGRRKDDSARDLADQSVASFEIDLQGKITRWDPGAEQLLERNENEALGKHVSLFFATKVSRFPTKDHLAALREGREQRIELRMKRGPGKFFDGVILAKPVDSDPTRIDCQASMVAERQRAVGALRRSEERLRYALEAASDGLWDWNLRTDSVVFSPRVSEILGQEFLSEGVRATNIAAWDSRVHAEDDPERQRALQRHFDGRTSAYESEYRLRTERGKWKWVAVRGRVTERDSAGEPLRMIGTITDISERKSAQEALKRSEEQYRNLFEYASDAVLLFDPRTGKIRDANEKAEQLLGYSSTDFKKMAIRDLHPGDQWQRVESALERSQSGTGSPFEVDGLTSKGKRVPLEINTRLVNYGGQQVYQSFIRDISQRLALEQQLRQSQKMETVGRLAGGVAHDFNNLLTAIQGYTTLLQSALPKGSEEREMTEEVFNAVERGSRLTTQLLTFSRQDIPHPVSLEMNSVVEDLEKMLRRLIGEHIQLHSLLNPDVGSIEADRGSIEQVITNLVLNAADAMPDGGTLTLRTDNVHLDRDCATLPGAPAEGDYVLFSVEDEGEGMDPETLSQIFDPFFTTKAPGSGTGLGLATVYGIIKQYQGHIGVDSQPGIGTTFRIYLPVGSGSPSGAGVEEDTPLSVPAGKETVLIVEDEPAVRKLARRFLETSGYVVVEAATVADAIHAAETSDGAIDLLLTDVIMPDLSGPELAKRLRTLQPELKVLYMSGYPGNFIARHGISEAEMGYLQKPFSLEALMGKMRQVLDS